MDEPATIDVDDSRRVIREVEARNDRIQAIGFALLIAICFVTLIGLVATIYTAAQAVHVIEQVRDESHLTRLVGEDVLARLETNRQAIAALSTGGAAVPTAPARISSPEPATPARRAVTPRRTVRRSPASTIRPKTPPRVTAAPTPTPCPLPICL